jgi:hypothetical protein
LSGGNDGRALIGVSGWFRGVVVVEEVMMIMEPAQHHKVGEADESTLMAAIIGCSVGVDMPVIQALVCSVGGCDSACCCRGVTERPLAVSCEVRE